MLGLGEVREQQWQAETITSTAHFAIAAMDPARTKLLRTNTYALHHPRTSPPAVFRNRGPCLFPDCPVVGRRWTKHRHPIGQTSRTHHHHKQHPLSTNIKTRTAASGSLRRHACRAIPHTSQESVSPAPRCPPDTSAAPGPRPASTDPR
eukprot:143474-Rhodomonas_salina.2